MSFRQSEDFLFELARAQAVDYTHEQLFPPEAVNDERHAYEFVLGLLLAHNPNILITDDQLEHYYALGLLYTKYEDRRGEALPKSA